MWTRSSNAEPVKPEAIERSGGHVILRKHFKFVTDTEDFTAHWEWDEWQMTADQYEVYQDFESQIREQSDALVELAEMIAG